MEISEEELTEKLNAVASEAYHLALSRFARRLRIAHIYPRDDQEDAHIIENALEWCLFDVPDAKCLMEVVPCKACAVPLQVNDLRRQELMCLSCKKQRRYPDLPY